MAIDAGVCDKKKKIHKDVYLPDDREKNFFFSCF